MQLTPECQAIFVRLGALILFVNQPVIVANVDAAGFREPLFVYGIGWVLARLRAEIPY